MGRKKKVVSKKKVAPVVAEETTQEPVKLNPDCKIDSAELKPTMRPVVLKSNHLRQSEINNRVALVMAFNPQILRNENGEWFCTIGYCGDTGLSTHGISPIDAILEMFNILK